MCSPSTHINLQNWLKKSKNLNTMENSMLMSGKTQYCSPIDSFPVDLQIQHSLNQNPRNTVCRCWQTDPNVSMRSKDWERLMQWWGGTVRSEHIRNPISSSPWSGRNPVLVWWEHRRTDQRVRTGSTGMEPHKCIQLTPGEGLGQLTGKCVVFSVTAGHSPAKRMSQDALHPSQTLIQSSSWA